MSILCSAKYCDVVSSQYYMLVILYMGAVVTESKRASAVTVYYAPESRSRCVGLCVQKFINNDDYWDYIRQKQIIRGVLVRSCNVKSNKL